MKKQAMENELKLVKTETRKEYETQIKVVDKSKFICEKCEREYLTKEDAEKCESSPHICIYNKGCSYPNSKNEKCDFHVWADEWRKCPFLKGTVKGKPNCFKNFDDGRNWRRGGPICDDCKFRVDCEKVSPKREFKDCRSVEEVYRQEVANRKYIARRNYETYMDSYGP